MYLHVMYMYMCTHVCIYACAIIDNQLNSCLCEVACNRRLEYCIVENTR